MQPPETRANGPEASYRRLSIWLVLASGLVAGVLATAGGELTYAVIHTDLRYPPNFETLSGVEKTLIRGRVRFQARSADETRKAVAAFGLLGAAVGLVLGLVGAGAGGPKGSSRLAAVAGGVWGAAAGAGLSRLLVPMCLEASDLQTGVLFMLLTHLAIFGGVGAAAGWALAWGSGEHRLTLRCMIGGVVGALLGTMLGDVINLIAFPLLRMYEPVPVKPLPRLILNLWVAIAVAAGVALAARKRLRGADATPRAS
jgi:hypothetical protein